ncbi:MAG: DUF1893 domain-containing protein [Peptococcaceae bacterium]|jgi:hypothetical protein|nr:DUF1893 domain-containing protein [Peptococcaceae bacterium]
MNDDSMREKADVLGVKAELLAQACDMIREQEISCVVISGDTVVHKADGRGVAPLLHLYSNQRATLDGSCVVDRVIGKAAAIILTLGKAKAVYGEVMSAAAQGYLAGAGIPCQYGSCVDVITGQGGMGICPIEASVLDIDDPEAGFAALTKRVAELRGSAV